MRKLLFVCGILSSILYAAITLGVALQWESYNSACQTVSELSAVGAPTRMLWVLFTIPYTLLVTAFAIGVWNFAHQNRPLRIAGAMLFLYGLLGVGWPFAPMHLRETLAAGGGTTSDTMHIVFASVSVLLMFLAIAFGAAALGKRFRIYSIVTMLVLVTFGALTFMDAPNVSTNLPTPYIGVWERINIGVFLLWVVVLAVILLSQSRIRPERRET